jgi:hypothetical protein
VVHQIIRVSLYGNLSIQHIGWLNVLPLAIIPSLLIHLFELANILQLLPIVFYIDMTINALFVLVTRSR